MPNVASSTRKSIPRFRRWSSLDRRLPLLISALLVPSVAAVSAWAYLEVRHQLVFAAASELEECAQELASLVSAQLARRMAEAERIAADPGLQRFMEEPSVESGPEIERSLDAVIRSAKHASVVELRSGDGVLLLRIPRAEPAASGFDLASLDGGAPRALGISSMGVAGDSVFFDLVTPVRAPSTQNETPGKLAGFLVIRRGLGESPGAELITRLIGSDASLFLGNRDGSTWTDLTRVVKGPLGAAENSLYEGEQGERRVGGGAPVEGAPWVVWVDRGAAGILAPAKRLLNRTIWVGLAVILAGGGAALVVSKRITKPLDRATKAAELVAASDLAIRLPQSPLLEVDRLSVAFNTMVDKVDEARRALEGRVLERTQELESTVRRLRAAQEELVQEEARRQSDQFFRALAENSSDLVSIIGSEGVLQYASPSHFRMLGYTPEEIIGSSFQELVHPDDAGILSEALSSLVRCPGGTLLIEMRLVHRAGHVLPVEGVAQNLLDHAVVQGIVVNLRDTTERQRMQSELLRRARELERQNRDLQDFALVASHDLQEPLRKIETFGDQLASDTGSNLSPRASSVLSRMLSAVSRLRVLIDEFLRFYRVTGEEGPLVRTSVEKCVAEAVSKLERALKETNAELTIEVPHVVEADPAQLSLLFQNLIDNALKFRRQSVPPRIAIKGAIERTSGRETCRITIADNGTGFAEHNVERIFGIFRRVHGSKYEGLGVGLSICRRIVERLGGSITARGVPDQGAVFTVVVPLQQERISSSSAQSLS